MRSYLPIILGSLVCLCVLAYFVLRRPATPHVEQSSTRESVQQAADSGKAANAEALSASAAAAASQSATAPFSHTYHNALGFSFRYPDALTLGVYENPEDGSLTVTVQNAGTHIGFQVFAKPWSGAGTMTAEQVEHDIPQIAAHNFQPVSLDGVPGLAFGATDANFGDSTQIWLVRKGFLYQISTYSTQGALLSKVLGTWQWQ